MLQNYLGESYRRVHYAAVAALGIVALGGAAFLLYPREQTLDCAVSGVREEYHISLLKEKGWQPNGIIETGISAAYGTFLENLDPTKGVVKRTLANGETARGRLSAERSDPSKLSPSERTYNGVANFACRTDKGSLEAVVTLTPENVENSVSPVVGTSYKLKLRNDDGKPVFSGMAKQ